MRGRIVGMNTEDPKRSAESFLAELNQPGYAASEPYELADFWYFDLVIEYSGNLPPGEQDQFAGAPGFVVSKRDGHAHLVSWEEYDALGLSKRK
jgi:hypothetical protein